MIFHARRLAFLPLALAGALTGCTSTAPQDTATTVTSTVSAEAQPSQAAECQAKDLRDSAFGRWMQLKEVPLTGGGVAQFEVSQNCYDPAQELSWAIVSLSGEAQGQALILLRHGDTVADPAPVSVDHIGEVHRTSERSISVEYPDQTVEYRVEHGQVQASAQPQGAGTLDLRGRDYRGPHGHGH